MDSIFHKLRSESTWKLLFLGVITYGVYLAFYIKRQTLVLNDHLSVEQKISSGLVNTVIVLNLLSLAVFVPFILVDEGHPIERISSLVDAAANISIIVWGFTARNRLNSLLSSQPGTSQWFHGFWTFIFSPLYFNYKVNCLSEIPPENDAV